MTQPEPLPTRDYSRLEKTIVDGMERTIADQYEDEDFRAYVYEAAMEAFYGPGYWPWRRSQKW